MKQEQQDALRAPFAKEKIQKLPTGGLQLDYVSHAWVTDRLLQVDPTWNWEPVAFDDQGLPKFDENGGLWIKLTVCGVTRYGYGEPQGRDKFDTVKGSIGNAIRNSAMRFGVALDLWAKETPVTDSPKDNKPQPMSVDAMKMLGRIKNAGSLIELAEVVPLIQTAAFTETEKQNLRIVFDDKKAELSK
jgi:hypothetical protein